MPAFGHRINWIRWQYPCCRVALSIQSTSPHPKEVAVEEESWGPIQVWKFESGFHAGHALDESSRFAGVVRFFEKRALPAFLFVYNSTTSPAAFILKLFHSTLNSLISAEPRPHARLLDHSKPFSSTFSVSSAMTLSRMHLPSISSVLTSNRDFLPGHSAVTKMDMEVPEPILLPVPDHLMVCPVVVLFVDFLSTQIRTENYSFGRSSSFWTPGLLI